MEVSGVESARANDDSLRPMLAENGMGRALGGVAPVPAETDAAGETAQQVVLLIDPDADSRAICTAILRHHGFRVLDASNGVEGIRFARERRPDLVVTELFVPTRRGWKVPELLRRDRRTARIPILALTARALPGDAERALAAGCDRYLAKPCEPLRMVQQVKEMIDPAAGRVTTPVGDDPRVGSGPGPGPAHKLATS